METHSARETVIAARITVRLPGPEVVVQYRIDAEYDRQRSDTPFAIDVHLPRIVYLAQRQCPVGVVIVSLRGETYHQMGLPLLRTAVFPARPDREHADAACILNGQYSGHKLAPECLTADNTLYIARLGCFSRIGPGRIHLRHRAGDSDKQNDGRREFRTPPLHSHTLRLLW